nr:type IV secretion system protein [Acidovorax sp. SUPP3334]
MGFMLIFAALPARAGVPVLDAANLANTAQQVIAWAQQAQDMVQQINKLQQQFQQLQTMTSKLEGIRNLGTILNDPQITAMLPPEMRDASRLLLDPKALVTSQANLDQIMSSFGITGSGNAGKSAADTFGRAQQILASTQSRSAQLTQLANRVNVTTDAKDSLDMVNRNVLESASINNQMMQTMASLEAARQATEMKRLADDQQFFKNLNSRAGQPLKSYAY